MNQAGMFTRAKKEIASYVHSTYKFGADAGLALLHVKKPEWDIPLPPEGADPRLTKYYERKIETHIQREVYLEENLKTAYAIIWGQCTDSLQAKIEALDDYEEIKITADAIRLLERIQEIVFNVHEREYIPLSVHKAKLKFYKMYQGQMETVQQYHERFKNVLDVVKHAGGAIGGDETIIHMLHKQHRHETLEEKLKTGPAI